MALRLKTTGAFYENHYVCLRGHGSAAIAISDGRITGDCLCRTLQRRQIHSHQFALPTQKLAYTSATPGKTRTVNFYRIEAEWEEARHAFRLVALPGYGYAKSSRKAQEEWAAGINTYLESRTMLREVILLCDLRHAPTALDKQMYTWIRANGYVGHVIATKADKVPVTKIRAQQKVLAQTLGTDVAHIHPYAGNVATKSFGSEELRLLLLPIVS